MSSALLPGRAGRAERVVRAARHLYEGGHLTAFTYAKMFGCSTDTAERDCRVLRSYLPIAIETVRASSLGGHMKRLRLASAVKRRSILRDTK